MPSIPLTALQSFLSKLEAQEERLLSWGVVDGSFTEDEVFEYAESFAEGHGFSADELVDAMERQRMLYALPHESGHFRTRTAEAVRLMAHLRQLFPRHLKKGSWRGAFSLVSDFRFSREPRRYPKWDQTAAQVIADTEERVRVPELQKKILRAMLRSEEGDPFKLAAFQSEATSQILGDLEQTRRRRGVIVCAGTGTGKTLAFYLPAFMRVAQRTRRGVHKTRGLATYPRTELLKDQLTSAFEMARRTDGVMSGRRRRKITLGAYFGDTPLFPSEQAVGEWAGWAKSSDGSGYVCPYLHCPTPKCDGRMVWRREDIKSDTEQLRCERHDHCGGEAKPDEIRLTRQSASEKPPDFVFTTTEMMNMLMSDAENSHVIGVGANESPDLVLLDEVHTYGGVHGAQVAYLLRRWQRAVNGLPQFTGLSATLAGADSFFARLIGVNPNAVREIVPHGEMEEQGAEYQVALRGDPVSRASQLSTTIQTAMLLRRVLDPPDDEPSGGLQGKKVFVFTDDLDATNRLFDDLNDAEGLIRRGGGFQPRQKPLASLRSSLQKDAEARFHEGQSWHLSEWIGHPHELAVPLNIDRTSSQDAGVDDQADVVVATASLEVGFDDPTVGAVLQHKAPMNVASFIQRKGRAGRPRAMRPWTVVSLSDYGRDRMAYQGYDMLFDPKLGDQALPISNRYVLRMQAVLAFMDWFAQRLYRDTIALGGAARTTNLWKDFAQPGIENGKDRNHARWKRQQREASVIENILRDGAHLAEIKAYLEGALDVDQSEVRALLWEPPRALMTAVLPTLLRRLKTGWKAYGGKEEPSGYNPLPEFVPGALFNDLNLPQITVRIPHRKKDDQKKPMRIRQAVQRFAPGRVSRRFSGHSQFDSYWVPPRKLGPSDTEQEIDVQSFCPAYDDLGPIQVWSQGGEEAQLVRCIRPHAIQTEIVDRKEIRISSNAFPDWRTQVLPAEHAGDATYLVSERLSWSRLVEAVEFFTHNRGASVEVHRLAVASDAELYFKKSDRDPLETRIAFTFGEDDEAAAVGYNLRVDGIRFRIQLPDDLGASLMEEPDRKGLAMRKAYFKHRLVTHPELEEPTNPFQRDWLHQALLAVLTARAAGYEEAKEPLARALGELEESGTLGGALKGALRAIFGASSEERDGNQKSNLQRIEEVCDNQRVINILVTVAKDALFDPSGDDCDAWIQQRFLSTLGGALLEACNLLGVEVEAGDLYLDLDAGPEYAQQTDLPEGTVDLWITESSMGGTGIVEAVEQRYAEDPRRFFRLVESALGASDAEIVDTELTRTLDLASDDAEVYAALQGVRQAEGVEALRKASAHLRDVLTQCGILCIHAVNAALNARLLRPGSTSATDDLVRRLLHHWRELEQRTGVEVEARVFAYIASQEEEYENYLSNIAGGRPESAEWRFSVIYSLLWPRGGTVRARALQTYNPFAILPGTDRLLVLESLPEAGKTVALDQEGWQAEVAAHLREQGEARLRSPLNEAQSFKAALLRLVSEPVELEYLHVYPQVEGIERDEDHITARLRLAEALQ